jgi:hypothetical protein
VEKADRVAGLGDEHQEHRTGSMLSPWKAFKARREERWLRHEVAGYAEYQQHVRMLIPFIY